MPSLKAGFHEHLTRIGVKYDGERNTYLLESDLKMSRSHANMVSFDENVSNLSTSMNLFSERNTFYFMKEAAIELTGQTSAPLYLL